MSLEAELQKGVYGALSASAPLAALDTPPGVFDRVPEGAGYPRVTIGEDQLIDESNGCATAFEAFVTVHVWSRAVGKIEAKEIGAAVRETLDAALSVDGWTCTEWGARDSRYFTDQDGLTTHGVLTFRYLFDAA